MKDLDLTTVERIERFIVFEGRIELLHWEDTSQWGFKIKLGLESRAELDHFDKTMKRSKKRGGQRYHCILYEEIHHQFEAQFAGRGWAETQGAHIALHVPDIDDQRLFRGFNTRDQGEKEVPGVQAMLILMEIGDDEILIDQTTRERVEALKGGPHSKAVAMLLQDEAFETWLTEHSIWKTRRHGIDMHQLWVRDAVVKEECGVKSKVEFDHDEAAWERWETQFHRPFIQYMERGQR